MYNLKSLKNVSKIVLLVVLTIMLSVLFVGCDNKKGADVSNENKITLTNEQCKVAIQAAATATETATKPEINSNVLTTKMLLSQNSENDFLFIEDESKYVNWNSIQNDGFWTLCPEAILKYSLDASLFLLNNVSSYKLGSVLSGAFMGEHSGNIYNNKIQLLTNKNGLLNGISIIYPNNVEAEQNNKLLVKFEIDYDFNMKNLNGFDVNFFIKGVDSGASIVKYYDNKLFIALINDFEKAPKECSSFNDEERNMVIYKGDRLEFLKTQYENFKSANSDFINIDFTSSYNKYLINILY